MAAQAKTELRLDLTAGDGTEAYVVSPNFHLGTAPNYTLHVDLGSGTAGETLIALTVKIP